MPGTVSVFVNCAVLSRLTAYDSVEIMGSEGYPIYQFLAGRTNQRDKEYGVTLNTCIRIATDIVLESRNAVSKDFILMFRLFMINLIPDSLSWDMITELEMALEDTRFNIITTGVVWHKRRVPTISTLFPPDCFHLSDP